MNKFGYIGIILMNGLFSSISVANISEDKPAIIHCPESVICSINFQLNSCIPEGTDSSFWQMRDNEGQVVKGVYNFKKIITDPHGGFCQYNNIDGRVERLVSLMTDRSIPNRFEPFLESSTLWGVVGYKGECISDDIKLCPLAEAPELVFLSSNNNEYDAWSADFYPKNQPYSPLKGVNYYTAVTACGVTSRCELIVKTKSLYGGFDAGTVTLDLTKDNFIKIVEVSPSSGAGVKCTIMKKPPFNTIYCVKK